MRIKQNIHGLFLPTVSGTEGALCSGVRHLCLARPVNFILLSQTDRDYEKS